MIRTMPARFNALPVADRIFGTLFVVLFTLSMIFTNFFAYSGAILGLIGAALYRREVMTQIPRFKTMFALMGAFSALALLCMIWSPFADDILSRALKVTVIIGFSGLLCCVMRARAALFTARPMIMILIAIWAVIAAVVAYDQIFDFPFYRLTRGLDETATVHGFVSNKYATTLFLTGWLLAGGLIAGLSHITPRSLAPVALMAALMAAILCNSWSQAAQITAILSAAAFVIFPYKQAWAWLGAKIALAAVVFAAPFLAITLYDKAADNINLEAGETVFTQAAGPQRLEIWSFISHKIMDHPFLGHGIEATRHITFDAPLRFWDSASVMHPHNFALQLWLEWGSLGAALAALTLVAIMNGLQKHISGYKTAIPMGCFVAWLTIASFSYSLWQSQFLGLGLFIFAVMAGAVMAPRAERSDDAV